MVFAGNFLPVLQLLTAVRCFVLNYEAKFTLSHSELALFPMVTFSRLQDSLSAPVRTVNLLWMELLDVVAGLLEAEALIATAPHLKHVEK